VAFFFRVFLQLRNSYESELRSGAAPRTAQSTLTPALVPCELRKNRVCHAPNRGAFRGFLGFTARLVFGEGGAGDMKSILEFSGVTMTYGRGRGRTDALHDVSLAVPEGAFTVLMGPSGAGKSTLLRLVLAMDRPKRGTIRVAGRDIHRLRRASIPYVRRNVGAVFQDFKLLPGAPPIENVAMGLQVLGLERKEIRERARHALDLVEIDPDTRRPSRCLSGGEQQRVAIARALAGDPAILLADEPTGNLDPRLTREVLDVLGRVCERGTTVVVATHDPLVLEYAPVTQELGLQGGRLVADSVGQHLSAVDDESTQSTVVRRRPEVAEAVA
jgi:cell division transport system ATP-binding protein